MIRLQIASLCGGSLYAARARALGLLVAMACWLALPAPQAVAQSAQPWAKNFGTAGADTPIRGITGDAAGNVYVAGEFSGTQLRIAAITLNRIGLSDAFVAKFDANGNLLWAQNYGGTASLAGGRGLAVDPRGFLLVLGGYRTEGLNSPNLPRVGLEDIFVMKLNAADGAIAWARAVNGPNAIATGEGIAVDAAGDVGLTGWYWNAPLSNPALALTGFRSGFAVKLSGATGNVLWSRSLGGSGAQVTATGAAFDGAGDFFVGGHFNGGPLTDLGLSRTGGTDGFVAKLTGGTGATVWARGFGGSGTTLNLSNLAVDGTGSVAASGDFSSGHLAALRLTRIGNLDGVVLKLDGGGNILWAQNYGGPSASIVATGLAADSAGNLIFAGYFSSASLSVPSRGLIGASDTIAMKIAGANGAPIWVRSLGGTSANTNGADIGIDGAGNPLLAGALFQGNVPAAGLTRIGRLDGFIVKLAATPADEFIISNGFFYNAAQPGRGYSLEQNTADRIFFASYGYEDGGAGRSIWLTGTLTRSFATNRFSGSLLQVTNGQVLGGSPVANPIVTDRGAMTLEFSTAGTARLTWPASFGGAPSVDLVRYPVNGTSVSPPAANIFVQTGWWAAASEPGRGYYTEVQGNMLFLATYMYRTDGSAVWYVASGPMATANSFAGILSEYQGGPGFLNPGRTGAGAVPLANNNVTIQWTSATTATITIGGRQVAVTRYSF